MSSKSKLFFVLWLFLLSIVGWYTLWYNSLIEIKPTLFIDDNTWSSASLRSDVKLNSNIWYLADSDFSMETDVVDLDTKDKDYVEWTYEYKSLKKFNYWERNFTLTEWWDLLPIEKYTDIDWWAGRENTEVVKGILWNEYFKSDIDSYKLATINNNKFIRDFKTSKDGLVDMVDYLDNKFSKNDVISSTGIVFDKYLMFDVNNNFAYEILHIPSYIFYLSNKDFDNSFIKFHNVWSKMMRSPNAINSIFGMQIINNLDRVLETKILVWDIDKQSVSKIMSSIDKNNDWQNSFKLFLASNLDLYKNHQFELSMKIFSSNRFIEIPYTELVSQWEKLNSVDKKIVSYPSEQDKSIIEDITYFNDAYSYKNLSKDSQLYRNIFNRKEYKIINILFLKYYRLYELTSTNYDKLINVK